MKYHPLPLSAPMVRAFLERHKTQLRDVIKPQPYEGLGNIIGPKYYTPAVEDKDGFMDAGKKIFGIYSEDGEWGVKCPWEVGDRLYVKEGWRWYGRFRDGELEGGFQYRADLTSKCFTEFENPNQRWNDFTSARSKNKLNVWRSSTHLPRWASRLSLEITGIRAEQLRKISDEDCKADGVEPEVVAIGQVNQGIWEPSYGAQTQSSYYHPFIRYWNSRHKKDFGWDTNPLVWVRTVKVI